MNDRVASLMQEKSALKNQVDVDVVEDDKRTYYGDVFSKQVEDNAVSLWPLNFRIRINGADAGEFHNFAIRDPAFDTHTLSFPAAIYKTTRKHIIGLYSGSPGPFAAETQKVFINLQNADYVAMRAPNNALNPTAVVDFGTAEHELTTNISNAFDCPGIPISECNTLYPSSVSALLLNGNPVIFFESVDLTRFETGEPLIFTPAIDIIWQGVSPEMDQAYFTFLDKTYSIDENGNVEQTERPDDLVTMTNERYE